MPTLYPDDFDEFGVPSLPEQTPLSSAGDSTRAHTPLLRDLGDAVEVMQRQAARKIHDHSGDGNDIAKGAKLLQVNTHEGVDTDTPGGIHHTVGEGHEQAARGDHVHDYNNAARLLNRPYAICTSTTRPAMPYQGLQIYETDTKRVRVWDTFGNTEQVLGLNSFDDYLYGNLNALPSSKWNVTYTQTNPSNPTSRGSIGTPNSGTLSWTDASNAFSRVICRRVDPADAHTLTDDQIITWKNGSQDIEDVLWFTSPASNDKYFRMSDDGQSYWRVIFGWDYVFVNYTTSGPANEKEIGRIGVNANRANITYRAQLVERTMSLYFMGELLGAVVDRNQVTSKGEGFRGWGTGMSAGNRFLGQTTPGTEDWIRIQDEIYYTAANRWTVLPVAKIPVVRLRQTTNQKLVNTGSIIEWGEELEDEFDFFNVANKTDIIVKEPGLYQINTAIQWDPSVVPDTAIGVLCINGIETTIRKQMFMRGGNLFQPGFSQTLDITGQLRFNTNDVLTVKVKYVTSASLFGAIFSWFDSASKINSRIDMNYIRV